LTETINGNSQNGTVYFTPEVVVVLSKLDVNKRNEIKVLAQQRLVAIVETNDGSYWVVGYQNGLELNAGTSATGTAFADLSWLLFDVLAEWKQSRCFQSAQQTLLRLPTNSYIYTFSFSLFCWGGVG
jgi:hypothetical protein